MLHLQLSDREVERVFAGQQPYGRPDLAEVAYFVARLRALGEFEQPPVMSPALRAQVEAVEAKVGRPLENGRPRHIELVRSEARRRVTRARWTWRLVGAAAAVVLFGGVAVAGWHAGEDGSGVDAETDGDRTGSSTTVVVDDAAVETGPAPPATEPPPVETPPDTAEAPPVAGGVHETEEIPSAEQVPEVYTDPDPTWPSWPPECPAGDWICMWEHYAPDDGRGRDHDDDGRPVRP